MKEVHRECDWLALVPTAMSRARLSMTAMAIDMGVSLPLLSQQLSGADNKHLSFRRMWHLTDLWRELGPAILAFHGLDTPGISEQDRRDLEYGRAIRLAQEQRFAR